MPFYKKLNNILKNFFNCFNFHFVSRCNKKFSTVIKLGKDPLDASDKTSLVYKSKCKDRFSVYIGETVWSLKKRISDHKTAVNTNDETLVIALHCMDNNPNFDFKKIEILNYVDN